MIGRPIDRKHCHDLQPSKKKLKIPTTLRVTSEKAWCKCHQIIIPGGFINIGKKKTHSLEVQDQTKNGL